MMLAFWWTTRSSFAVLVRAVWTNWAANAVVGTHAGGCCMTTPRVMRECGRPLYGFEKPRPILITDTSSIPRLSLSVLGQLDDPTHGCDLPTHQMDVLRPPCACFAHI